MTKIFIIAGEVSGDQLGAALIPELKQQFPNLEIHGIGGDGMLHAGLPRSLFKMDELSVMGIAEILPKIPKFIKLINHTVDEIVKFNPDIVITIDAPDFSFRVQKKLKALNIRAKKIHYVAPTVWAWRAGRARKVAQFLDGMVCLFPFEPIYFEREGLRACFAGHPVMQSGIFSGEGAAFRAANAIDINETVIGVFCGSRKGEIEFSVPIIKDVITRLNAAGREFTVMVPTLPKWHEQLQHVFSDLPNRVVVTSDIGQKWNAFNAMNAAIAVSGTVALEIALAGIPHVIFYKMNKLTWAIIKRVSKTKFAHLGNILLMRLVYPELIQENATAQNITMAVEEILNDNSAQKIATVELKNILSPEPNENAAKRAAAFIKRIN